MKLILSFLMTASNSNSLPSRLRSTVTSFFAILIERQIPVTCVFPALNAANQDGRLLARFCHPRPPGSWSFALGNIRSKQLSGFEMTAIRT